MSKDHLTLGDCTKADLLWIIKYMIRFGGSDDYYLQRALNQLWYEKEKQRIDEGDKYLEISNAKLSEYFSLMQQHQGKSFLEIPDGVLEKAAQLLKEAEAADKKWRKSLGLKEG